jgi:hypothetical protein
VYGRIFEAGMTEAAGANPAVLAQLGWGPVGSDPRANPQWHWTPTGYNSQVGDEDEYQTALAPLAPGQYAYTFRFSVDQNVSFTYCDLDGAGTNPGLTFDPAQLGLATMTP